MKSFKLFAAAAVALTVGVHLCPAVAHDGAPNISVFSHVVRRIANERKVPFEVAAEMLYALGVHGVDVNGKGKGDDLAALASTKIKPINFYVFLDAPGADGGAAECRTILDKAEKYGVPRCMLIPPSFTKGGDQEAEFARMLAQLKMIVAEAKKRGITITVEDFGGTNNPCSYLKYLKRFLDEIPDLRLALDSGNLYYAGRGDDILELMAYAKGRIAHVHLKDQKPDNARKYETLGLGAVPNREIVRTVSADGYAGWYTLENLVGADTYEDVVRQVAVLKSWLSGK